jgi:uncharacterized protein YecE (DUF72 family)
VSDVRTGISGWRYPPWRGVFYPPGLPQRRELEYASRRMRTIEINGSFYSLQRPESYARWAAETPAEFLFSVKGPRFVTHMKKLAGVEAPLANFFASGVLALGAKLGPVLWQLPPTFKRDDERLAAVLEALPGGRHCFEFREASWYAEEVYELLRRRGVALVIPDSPKYPFRTFELTAEWTFVRFHHGRRGRGGNYSETELREWADRLDSWRGDGLDVYAYFNNDWEGYAVRNGLRLKELLGV